MTTAPYTFRKTDPTKQPFVVQPYTTNGPLTPNSPSPLYPYAVSANTTLVLAGQGKFEYGEFIQQGLVYMLENFSNSTPPAFILEGQTWYDNVNGILNVCVNEVGPITKSLFYADGSLPLTGNLDMDGFRIIDLGSPNPGTTDAASAIYAETYADNAVTIHAADLSLHKTVNQDTFLSGLNLPTLTSTEANYLIGVTSSIQTQIDSKVAIAGDTMTGTLTLPVAGVYPQPNSNLATTITYVNDAITAIGGSLGLYVLKAGDTMTGQLNLVNPVAAANATRKDYVDNFFVGGDTNPGLPGGHTQPSSSVDYQVSNVLPSYLVEVQNLAPAAPISVEQTLNLFDEALGTVARPLFERYTITGDAVTRQFRLPFFYTTETNKLNVAVQSGAGVLGEKMFHALRAVATSAITPTLTSFVNPSGGETAGIPAGAYPFTITVDGTPYVLAAIPIAGTETFTDVYNLILSAMNVSSVPAIIRFFGGMFSFYSNTQGVGTDVDVTTTLFDVLPGALPLTTFPITSVNVTVGFERWTLTGDQTSTINVGAPFAVTGSTSGDGAYTVRAVLPNGTDTDVYVNEVIPGASGAEVATASFGRYFNTTTNYTAPALPGAFTLDMDYKEGPENITAQALTVVQDSTGNNYFAIAGNFTIPSATEGTVQQFSTIVITGGPNAGTYTVKAVDYNITNALATTIYVYEPISAVSLVGTLTVPNNIQAFDSTDWITFLVAPAATDLVELIYTR